DRRGGLVRKRQPVAGRLAEPNHRVVAPDAGVLDPQGTGGLRVVDAYGQVSRATEDCIVNWSQDSALALAGDWLVVSVCVNEIGCVAQNQGHARATGTSVDVANAVPDGKINSSRWRGRSALISTV